MKLSKAQRLLVWNKSGGRCWYCGCELPQRGWHADHFLPVARGLVWKPESKGSSAGKYVTGDSCYFPENDTVENMVPCCMSCNVFKSSSRPEDFRRRVNDIKKTILHHSIARIAVRFGILTITDEPVVFWYEKQRQTGEVNDGNQ